MTFLLLPLFALVVTLAAGWYNERRARHAAENAAAAKINAAYERLHEVSNSALRGAPAVRWTHRVLATGRVHHYWRLCHDGRDALISEIAMTNAKRLADLILPDEPEVTTNTGAKSKARPAGGSSSSKS